MKKDDSMLKLIADASMDLLAAHLTAKQREQAEVAEHLRSALRSIEAALGALVKANDKVGAA